MLVSIFKSVLIMSAAGGLLGLLLMCVRPVTERLFGARWQYYIYLAVLLVMILPISVSLPKREAALPQNEIYGEAFFEEAQGENFAFPTLAEHKERPDTKAVEYLSILWLLDAAAALLIRETRYVLFLRTLRKNSAEENISNIPPRLRVRRTALLDAPLLTGAVRPCLYLPKNLSEREMRCILLHELTHFSRHDILYKRFAAFVKCVHWFNPVIYFVVRKIDEQCEISCDEAVSLRLSEAERKDYMTVLLDMISKSTGVPRPLTTQMASGKKILKRRFYMIKYSRKKGAFTAVLSVTVALLLFSAAALASGIAAGLNENTMESSREGEGVEFENEPFIASGEVYAPLREFIEKSDIYKNSVVEWDSEGAVSVDVGDTRYLMIIDLAYLREEREGSPAVLVGGMKNAPILLNAVTYVPYSYIQYIFPKENISFSSDGAAHLQAKRNTFSAPLEGEITQMFSELHPAIDIAAKEGESVRAAADGTVTETGFSAELGNYVIIGHERGFVTEYCCGKEILVKEGQKAERGDVIMTAGSTGKSTGCHLHFAIKENGVPVNPENFFYLKKSEPEIFSENSAFLKERIDDAMKRIYAPNSPVPYSSKVISHTYDGVKGMASFYVEIKTDGDDSNNYLTINFIKGSDGWMTYEYYLEK